MSRRAVAGVLALILVGSGPRAAPAADRAPGKVPNEVQIKDPAGDANFLNSHNEQDDGDNPTPVDLTVPDILKVWFTNDAKTISVHIQTEAPPPAIEASYELRAPRYPLRGEDASGLWPFSRESQLSGTSEPSPR